MDCGQVKVITGLIGYILISYLAYGCLQRDQNVTKSAEKQNSTEQMIKGRIEIIKRQILNKLRLSEPPIASSNLNLPTDAIVKQMLKNIKLASKDDYEDYYATTQNVVFLPKKITTVRNHNSSKISTRMEFHIDPVTEFPQGKPSAHLWVYRNQRNVSRNIHYAINVFKQEKVLHIDRMTPTSSSNWRNYDVTSVLSNRTEKNSQLIFALDCHGCHDYTIGTTQKVRPFIVISASPSNHLKRSKRHIECASNSSHCCRQKFLLSFESIGWDDWILFPKEYDANFCRGDCTFDVTLSRYYHSNLLQELLQRELYKKQSSTVELCCSPSKMSGISIIYMDNGNIIHRIMPNMIVEACDCA